MISNSLNCFYRCKYICVYVLCCKDAYLCVHFHLTSLITHNPAWLMLEFTCWNENERNCSLSKYYTLPKRAYCWINFSHTLYLPNFFLWFIDKSFHRFSMIANVQPNHTSLCSSLRLSWDKAVCPRKTYRFRVKLLKVDFWAVGLWAR